VYPNEHSGLLQKWDTEAWKSLSEGVALTILIVDDEPAVLSYIAAIVRKEGYEVLQADGGDEALAICESRACCFDLMISDVAMPRMNGRALAECMNRRYPGVPIIFVSGFPESREIVAGLTARGFANGYSYLRKPFMAQELVKAIRATFKTVAVLRASACPDSVLSVGSISVNGTSSWQGMDRIGSKAPGMTKRARE